MLAEASFVTIDTWLSVWADDRLASSSTFYIAVYGGCAALYFVMTLGPGPPGELKRP